MNPEQDESLVARAATWVPPWRRRYGDGTDDPDDTGAAGDTETTDDSGAPAAELPAEDAESAEPYAEDVEPRAEDVELRAEDVEPGVEDVELRVEDVEPRAGEVEPRAGEVESAGPVTGTDFARVDTDEVDPDALPAEPLTPAGWTEMVGVPTHRQQFVHRDDSLVEDDFAPLVDVGRRLPPVQPVGTPEDLRAALEAIMLVVDQPVTEAQLADVLDVPAADVAAHLTGLAAEYTAQRRGFDLRRAAGGWRLYTRHEYAPYVERFVLDGQSVRLTQAALETLAVIAYQQPVTRSRISAIRGVNCDGVVRTLVTRGLIEECGIQPESGATLYRTTALFLEKLGLDSVDELPPLAPFLPDDVEGLADVPR